MVRVVHDDSQSNCHLDDGTHSISSIWTLYLGRDIRIVVSVYDSLVGDMDLSAIEWKEGDTWRIEPLRQNVSLVTIDNLFLGIVISDVPIPIEQ